MSELYLSAVLGKTVIDELGREIGKLHDLIMVPGKIFPEVSHLLVRQRKETLAIPWRDVSLFNPLSYRLKVRRVKSRRSFRKEGDIPRQAGFSTGRSSI